MDRISQLPDFVVHHILSFFDALHESPAELVRMSVLSKNWFDLTASFPILDFSIDDFRCRESYFKYVEYTMSRFCHQQVTAHTLKLITTVEKPAEIDIVNRCLELVLKKGVKVLVIVIINSFDVQKYQLPNILLSVSVLKNLIICGCELPSSLMVDAVKFKSLIKLMLVDVHIDDEVIKYLTTSCPLLQEFKLRCCHGFKRFCVYGHQNLQKAYIWYNTPVERIDIDAPNLSDLLVADKGYRGAPRMNLASCKKLTTVTYMGHLLPNLNGYSDFLSNFPFIENLFLITKYECNNIKLASHSLRTLVLQSDCDLEDIEFSMPEFSMPNLVLFVYSHNNRLLSPLFKDIGWPPVCHSTHLKTCMQCYLDSYIDTLWFKKLRQFLDKKNGFKVFNMYIHTSQKFTELEKLKAIQWPPYELEHVELQIDKCEESSILIAFVDAVLWCCRPQSLTLRSSFPSIDFEEQSDVVKFTYEKLLQQEDEGHTNIQIVSSSSSKAQKRLMDLKSLSMVIPRDGKAISFIKKEVTEEEAG